MNRRTYIYLAVPLFVLLSCGQMFINTLGITWASLLAYVFIIAAWGVVWMRLYSTKLLRPEFAMLTILPHSIYFISKQVDTHIFEQEPMWQNLYMLTWIAFAWVSIRSIRSTGIDTPRLQPMRKDPIFLLLVPLILLYTVSTFVQYYTALTSLI